MGAGLIEAVEEKALQGLRFGATRTRKLKDWDGTYGDSEIDRVFHAAADAALKQGFREAKKGEAMKLMQVGSFVYVPKRLQQTVDSKGEVKFTLFRDFESATQ